MIALLQRVRSANVLIQNQSVAQIGVGLLVLVGFEKGDQAQNIPKLMERILSYRIFGDDKDRMNQSLRDLVALQQSAGLLLVPQFTLAAEAKGRRPSFASAADPVLGKELFLLLVKYARDHHPQVEEGMFGADMQVGLINDGPVTFWLQVK